MVWESQQKEGPEWGEGDKEVSLQSRQALEQKFSIEPEFFKVTTA